MGVGRRLALALVAGAVLAFGGAGVAQGATIGGHPASYYYCDGAFPLAQPTYVVPSNGSITSFSYQSGPGNTGDRLAFKVWRPVGGNDYTVVGTTDVVTLATDTDLETFNPAAPIAVQTGDILGFWTETLLENCGGLATDTTVFQFPGQPNPGVGDTVSLPGANNAAALNVSAQFTPGGPPHPSCFGQAATIDHSGNNSGVVVNGTSGNDVIVTGNGNDTVDGKGGNDVICTQDGNDFIQGSTGNDEVFGGDGNDTVKGSAGNDTVVGGTENDNVDGGDGTDNLRGQDGDDILNGGNGNDDLVVGGVGSDLFAGNAGTGDVCAGDFYPAGAPQAGTDKVVGNHGCETITQVP